MIIAATVGGATFVFKVWFERHERETEMNQRSFGGEPISIKSLKKLGNFDPVQLDQEGGCCDPEANAFYEGRDTEA